MKKFYQYFEQKVRERFGNCAWDLDRICSFREEKWAVKKFLRTTFPPFREVNEKKLIYKCIVLITEMAKEEDKKRQKEIELENLKKRQKTKIIDFY